MPIVGARYRSKSAELSHEVATLSMSTTATTTSSGLGMETVGSTRTALVIDGSYAMIGARDLGGKIDYIKLRAALEEQASTQFGDCWFFDQNPSVQRLNPALIAEYHMLKFAPPDGPQFQVSLFPMKKYNCHCRKCGNHFTQNVQKGVDNGIATKILSLAYENICDRFILFAGDGDFYSSLSHVRNVLRKDIWVIGYRGTVSGDLQQLASRVLWMNDLWSQVKNIHQERSQDNGRREEGRRDKGRNKERTDEVRWFEDHEGEDFQFSNDSCSPPDETQEGGSGRQVVIAPVDEGASGRSSQPVRGGSRGREGRLNGRSRGRKGRGRSRSRSRERPRAKPPSIEIAATSNALPVDSAAPPVPASVASVPARVTSVPAGVAKRKRKPSAKGKRGPGERNGKKRKRNGADMNGQGHAKRGARGDTSKQADDAPVFTLSDISSDDEDVGGKPFPLSLPVPLRSAAPVMTAQDHDAMLDEIGGRTEVIDLASETESE
ncbi:hypothetical protein, variant 2 [Phytophthora nicotianae CJ01A1]|uniref:NYN domain-containing protein n=6 Tax=Phytophthora nicotianae TaxID=4792 RepID=W2LFE4_PHYNI|nr:hypothetical protein, variant 2 [Phytophthora nicotianae]ETL95439.1 hypothetical protein, variant 2 [Phytophthora nicotianae]ETM48638.1 hypothetical protein, variant 2 [Phytophthora nicotianae]ETP18766.1 hypothetical protein, variant 2 [Phytophthora nicotianae CJ01A1]